MEIMPNWLMVALQVAPFLVTILALHQILFKPMLAYLDGRDQVIEGGKAEAAELEAQITERMAEYEAKLAAAKAQVTDLRNKLRAQAKAEYDTVLKAAHNEAERRIGAALVDIDAQRAAASSELHEAAPRLAGRIAVQVLGRELAAG